MKKPQVLKHKQLQKWLPTRKKTDNKSQGGRVLIWAGSKTMPGAATLSAKSASRMGAGYVHVSNSKVLQFFPEAMIWDKKDLSRFSAVLIGPGMGVNQTTLKALRKLKKTSIPVVIDADALTVAARYKLFPFPSHWVATPHSGELSRFLNISADEVQKNRQYAIEIAQKKLGCAILLKGFQSLFCDGKNIDLIPTGNVALAKGGSGDVLGGMIVGLLAQGCSPREATLLAAYLHGEMADQWIKEKKDHLSLTPSDLIEKIPEALYRLRKK